MTQPEHSAPTVDPDYIAVPGRVREDRRWVSSAVSRSTRTWWRGVEVTKVLQFYGGSGVPFVVPGRPDEIAAAWISHRQRLRSWFAALAQDGWSGATRCTDWRVVDLAQHLVSGAQFLGYTLHQARKGEATRLLEGFDSQQTAVVTAADFDGLSPQQLLEQMTAMDARVQHELGLLAGADAAAPAEAPPGQVPAYVAVNHFLFDSWVHERDLLLPANELPVIEPSEAAMVASYVVALAGVARAVDDAPPPPLTLRIHLTDLDRDLLIEVADGGSTVTFAAPEEPANVRAEACDLVDFATGRKIDGELDADPTAIAFLSRLATVMS
jgi:uncharacterized protein (TIGR03083 family)